MSSVYIVTGTLTDEQTVTLDKSLPLVLTKVRLVIEPLTSSLLRPYLEVIAKIRKQQQDRGHKARLREDVDDYLRQERDSWE